jgi:hypothetical protein
MNRTILVTVCASLALGASVVSSRRAHPVDPVTEWSMAASAAAGASGMAPLRAPISFAILHLAMYDAVNAIAGDHQTYAVRVRATLPASTPAAAIEAGYHVMLAEFASEQQAIRSTYEKLLATEPESAERTRGMEIGQNVARQLLALRKADRRNETVSYEPGSASGGWVPTPPEFLAATTAWLARVTPFTMETPSQFRTAGPPRLASRKWAEEFNEVKALGGATSTARTPEQTATALFWEPLAGTVWPATIRRMAAEERLDVSASARFQASAFSAFADGLIACWDAKFFFNSWRPVTAIRNGGSDGNDHTAAEAAWEPLAVTPNFPEYPSGHACVTSAVAFTIEDFFHGAVRIPARSVRTGTERVYARASDAVAEVVEARMLLGLHFRSGDEDGAEIGRRIARQIQERWFRKSRSQSSPR